MYLKRSKKIAFFLLLIVGLCLGPVYAGTCPVSKKTCPVPETKVTMGDGFNEKIGNTFKNEGLPHLTGNSGALDSSKWIFWSPVGDEKTILACDPQSGTLVVVGTGPQLQTSNGGAQGLTGEGSTNLPSYPDRGLGGWDYMMLTSYILEGQTREGGDDVARLFGPIDADGNVVGGNVFGNVNQVRVCVVTGEDADRLIRQLFQDQYALSDSDSDPWFLRSQNGEIYIYNIGTLLSDISGDLTLTIINNRRKVLGGIHTICWSTDDESNIDGVGARYFNFENFAS